MRLPSICSPQACMLLSAAEGLGPSVRVLWSLKVVAQNHLSQVRVHSAHVCHCYSSVAVVVFGGAMMAVHGKYLHAS